MPCRSAETFDTEVNVTWMGLNPPLNIESRKERKANGRLYWWDWSLDTKTSRQSFTHTHTKTGSYLIISFPEPLWLAKITQTTERNCFVIDWWAEQKKLESCSQNVTSEFDLWHRHPHAHEPLSPKRTLYFKRHFLSQAVQPEPVRQSTSCFANLALSSPSGTRLSPATMI